MMGRFPQKGTDGRCFFFWSWVSHSTLLFPVMPHINSEASGCGDSRPPKNPPRFLNPVPRLVAPRFGPLPLLLRLLRVPFPRVFVWNW